jgi:predicted alpha/beta-hydrolase family hydrolase
MTSETLQPVTIHINEAQRVSGVLKVPSKALACYVVAHGAGAGMHHPFMVSVADGLAERGIATLRYQFPYMELGSKRSDPPSVAHATVRAAVVAMSDFAPDLTIIAGGKSFGARMTSQTHAESPLPGVCGIAFLGFPLHPAGRPSQERGKHLVGVRLPMLFLQGSRDTLADLQLVQRLVKELGKHATLKVIPDADHSFHVPVRTGRKYADVRGEMLDLLSGWIDMVVSSRSPLQRADR